MPSIHVIQINVTDMDLAMDFYCDKLGFPLKSRDLYPDLVKLENGSIPLVLYKVPSVARLAEPEAAPVSLVVTMDHESLEACMEELRRKGVELIHDTPQVEPIGRYATIRDPFGNILDVVRFL